MKCEKPFREERANLGRPSTANSYVAENCGCRTFYKKDGPRCTGTILEASRRITPEVEIILFHEVSKHTPQKKKNKE